MKTYFAHEHLEACRQSLSFVVWTDTIWNKLPRGASVTNQLDRARTSIPLNIAEGNGKATVVDKCKFFDISHGSALECAACLDLLFISKSISEAELEEGKILLCKIVGLLIGLIKSKMPDHWLVKEVEVEYRAGHEALE